LLVACASNGMGWFAGRHIDLFGVFYGWGRRPIPVLMLFG
jgi:hypothetical protein